MAPAEVVLIAAGLAMDCFAVAVSHSVTPAKQSAARLAWTMALLFGGFQSAMALAGWAAGSWLRASIAGFGHWAAFVLLGCVGLKMIIEAFREKEAGAQAGVSAFVLVALAFATSIDALAAGVSFALLGIRIAMAAAVIGIVSMLFTLAGARLGRSIGARFGRKAEIAGGLVLIGIGAKLLF